MKFQFRHLGPRLSIATTGGDVASPCDPSTTDGSGLSGAGGSGKKFTTTGKMQMDPFNPGTNYYPPQPPSKFQCMDIVSSFKKLDKNLRIGFYSADNPDMCSRTQEFTCKLSLTHIQLESDSIYSFALTLIYSLTNALTYPHPLAHHSKSPTHSFSHN